MSIVSWREEFYPIKVYGLFYDKIPTDVECLDHALKKWTGALPENLKKHNVTYHHFRIEEHVEYHSSNNYKLQFNEVSCALCKKYPRTLYILQDRRTCVAQKSNEICPLNLSERQTCYQYNYGTNVYVKSLFDPTPMILALEKTKHDLINKLGPFANRSPLL